MKLEKLVVGVIGLGMGHAHLGAALDYGAEVAIAADPLESKYDRCKELFNFPREKWTKDWRDVVNHPDVNVVIIATPDQMHAEHIKACFEAGKHVMCEKPLALTREEIVEIVKMCEEYPDCKFMIGQICRFTPSFVLAKQYIDEGKLGDLYFVEGEYAHDYLHMFEAHENDEEPYWRLDPKRNGVVGGGCHTVDLLRWLTDSDPEEVFAYGSHKLLPMVPYDDANVALLKFPNGVMGKVFVSTGCKRNYTMRTCIYGTKGTIIMTNGKEPVEIFLADENGKAPDEPIKIDATVNNHNAVAEFKQFADALVNDTPIITTVYEGAKTVEVCLSIVESAKIGKAVKPNYDFSE